MKYLIFTFTIVSLIACSQDEENFDNFLECSEIGEKYKRYNGEKIECQFHYDLTEYNNQHYIELIAHCADLTRPFVINENCEDICETLPYDKNSECGKYLSDREKIKTLLIRK